MSCAVIDFALPVSGNALILIVPPSAATMIPAFEKAGQDYFANVGPALGRLFGIPDLRLDTRLTSLLAFIYTYHYLNWFSKTSIIKWHEIPKSRTAIIVGLWLIALGLYGYSYQAGMLALYFLSVLHVMLEFPLNHYTFAGIGKELYALARSHA